VDSAYNTAVIFLADRNDTVKLRVTPFTSGGTGSFAVAYNPAPTTARPNVPDGSETRAFPLSPDIWTNGVITSNASGAAAWYSFNVISGTTYYVWWNDSKEGDHTEPANAKNLDIRVSATYSDGALVPNFTSAGVDSAYNTAVIFLADRDDTVSLRVTPFTSGATGTFGIMYNSTGIRPSVPIASFLEWRHSIDTITRGDVYQIHYRSSFDIDRLRGEGYTHYKIKAWNEVQRTSSSSHLWVVIYRGHNHPFTHYIGYEERLSSSSSWLQRELNTTVAFSDFDNIFSVHWGASGANIRLGYGFVSVDAIKQP
jgi:hypothetical protein